ncbi:MAG: hypothetical protein ABI854_05540 [Betaproteobacteria bacterium]
MNATLRTVPLVVMALIAGCVTVPSGPSVMVLPGDGRSFDQFRYDDGDCRNYAQSQVGGATTDQAAADSVAKSAILGTLIGAAAGGAIDGRHGAAAGAGAGLLLGAVAGGGAAQGSAYGVQRRYDFAFQQCMYAKGHRIASAGGGPRYVYPPMGYSPPPVYYAPPPAPAPR